MTEDSSSVDDSNQDKPEDGQQTTPENTGQKDSRDYIKEANEAAARIEAANKTQKELLERQERLMAEQKLSGRGAVQVPAPKKVESAKEYSQKVLRGEA